MNVEKSSKQVQQGRGFQNCGTFKMRCITFKVTRLKFILSCTHFPHLSNLLT